MTRKINQKQRFNPKQIKVKKKHKKHRNFTEKYIKCTIKQKYDECSS
jgi:hypothetical protein